MISPERTARFIAAARIELARRSFSTFVKQAWQYVPSMDPLVWGWHMDSLCDHLQAVAQGKIRKIVINVPPGHAKTALQCILWPAWIWTWWPECQFLFATYSANLSQRASTHCRALLESDWYRNSFSKPDGWTLREDQNAKAYFANTRGGERIAIGVGGTGRRAHIIGLDDPLEQTDASSQAMRESANDWISQTLSQRFVNAATGCISLIMQRLHEDDPSGFLLRSGDYEHLMMPSEYDPDRQYVTHTVVDGVKEEFQRDPRTESGELLFPERFSRKVLEAFKLPNALGEIGFAGQHQQLPMPAGGGMFKAAAWRFWRYADEADRSSERPRGCTAAPSRKLPDMEQTILSVDATFKKTTSGSYVAIHVWGKNGPDRFLLDRFHERVDFADTLRAFKTMCSKWPQAHTKVIEAQANGEAVISMLEREVPGLKPVKPRGGKESRAAMSQAYQSSGNLYLPDAAPWLDEFVAEFTAFPKAGAQLGDDDVDACSQALDELEQPLSTAELWAQADLS